MILILVGTASFVLGATVGTLIALRRIPHIVARLAPNERLALARRVNRLADR